MVNFPTSNNIKKTKRQSIGKRESSQERRRSTTNIVTRSPSGNRIVTEPKDAEAEIIKISDKQNEKPPTSNSTSSGESRTDSVKTKRPSLVGKPPQSPSSKLNMQKRRNSGRITKTTKSSGLGKNQTAPCASPKKKKSPKNKNKPASKLAENTDNGEKKLVLNSEKNSISDLIDVRKIPVSEVSECQLASFTTTETESVATDLTESTIDKFNNIPSEASEVLLQPVAQIRPEPVSQEEKYTNNTILIDDDMLGMMVGALGDKYRTYIPNLRAHKVTVDQLMHAEFDATDYLKMGILENDVPAFMSHFNGGHELSLNANDTKDFQSANDETPENIEEFTTEFDFRTEKIIFDDKSEIEVKDVSEDVVEKVTVEESSAPIDSDAVEESDGTKVQKPIEEFIQEPVEESINATVETEVVSEEVVEKLTVQESSPPVEESDETDVQKPVEESVQESIEEFINSPVETEKQFEVVCAEVDSVETINHDDVIESNEPVNTHVIFPSDEESDEESDEKPAAEAFQIHESTTQEPSKQETTTQEPDSHEPTTLEPTTQEPKTFDPEYFSPELDTIELMEHNLEKCAKLIEADAEPAITNITNADLITDDNMTVENIREVLINTADKIHEITGNIECAENLIRTEPEQVLVQNNSENLPNDKVPIEGILDEIRDIEKLTKECKDLGKELERKVEEAAELEEALEKANEMEKKVQATKDTIKGEFIGQISELAEIEVTKCETTFQDAEQFLTDCEMEEGEIKSEEESGVDQGNSSLQTESEAPSKDTHNTSTSSTASVGDIKKYALIFGTGALISVGMYKLLRR